jgi:hypothetical protein
MNVARTTYRAALVAAAMAGAVLAAPAVADDWKDGNRGRWTEERRGDRGDDRRWDGDRRWDDRRRHDGRWDDRGRRGPPPGYRHPPGYRYGWAPPPRWTPPPRWAPPPRYYHPPPRYYYPPPRGYYAPPPGYYWRGSYGPRHYWRDDGDLSLTIRVPL